MATVAIPNGDQMALCELGSSRVRAVKAIYTINARL